MHPVRVDAALACLKAIKRSDRGGKYVVFGTFAPVNSICAGDCV